MYDAMKMYRKQDVNSEVLHIFEKDYFDAWEIQELLQHKYPYRIYVFPCTDGSDWYEVMTDTFDGQMAALELGYIK